MEKLTIVKPHCMEPAKTERLNDVLQAGLEGYDTEYIECGEEFGAADLRGRRIIFAISLGESGINLEYYQILKRIRLDPKCLSGSVGGIIIDGNSELYTKAISRDLVFSANMAGCSFPGRPLVEGTATLFNFTIIAKNLHTDNYGAYRESVRDLIRRVAQFDPPRIRRPRLLALHAGNAHTSNTLQLWGMVREHLDADIREISLRDGEVWDCRGCSYETCLHLGEESRCFYGGVITREVYPEILDCDGLVMICPNYNDAISANLSAFINRLTAIFRVHRFFDQRLYAIIVSGYSGSDIVARQLISGLNMNKTFLLPPAFALMRTANDPRTIGGKPGIEEDARNFARQIMNEFRGSAEAGISSAT